MTFFIVCLGEPLLLCLFAINFIEVGDKMFFELYFILNHLVFVYELSGCGFESRCSHINKIRCTMHSKINLVNVVKKSNETRTDGWKDTDS